MRAPSVSVILPILDERDTIDDVLTSLLDQRYDGPLEIVVADGGSTDGTRERLVDWARRAGGRLRVIDNPDRRQSPGLNRAAAVATGEILVRADGHTVYAPDYVARSVAALDDGADAAGGRMNPVGRTRFGRGVAAAMNSPLTMGPARFHHATRRESVDTVYLGAFRRDDFFAVGGFRGFPSGAAEDADFYHRWRASGRTVVVDPAIVSRYTPRDDPRSLWRQYLAYGRGKAEMLWANGRFPSWRPLAPLGLVAALGVGAVLALLGWPWLLLVVVAAWWAVLGWVAVTGNGPPFETFLAAAIMHLAYGLGVVVGLLAGPGPVRRSTAV
ncbi:MAG TPA: glycosyltransferase [Actinobacteria bacterium]|nr:glycosyltransferase [Actinomycetota bacterium]